MSSFQPNKQKAATTRKQKSPPPIKFTDQGHYHSPQSKESPLVKKSIEPIVINQNGEYFHDIHLPVTDGILNSDKRAAAKAQFFQKNGLHVSQSPVPKKLRENVRYRKTMINEGNPYLL